MSKKIILVVEDELALSGAIKLKLNNESFDVLVSDNVSEAKKIFDDNEVSLVWLDHYLKGYETGLDLIAYVKKKDDKVPVIVVTNNVSSAEQFSYMKLGVDKYCVKTNYTLNELVDEVVKLVS